MSTVVLSAGGTGGHLFPAQALASELTRRGTRVVVMTDARGKNYGEAFPGAVIETVPSASFASRSPLKLALAPLEILRGIAAAYIKLRRIKPAAVIGFGGYPSLPVMLAARLAGLPTAVHEQNAVLGRVNRFVGDGVHAVAASFPIVRFAPKDQNRIVFTGNPVRPAVVSAAQMPYEAPSAEGSIHLLVFGGSQGARALSEIVPQAIAKLPPALCARLQIVQQCRPEDINSVRSVYAEMGVQAELASFFSDMPQRIAAAHLVIARSGASTIGELSVIGRPAILIPYPHATDDHQTANADVLVKAGAAWAIQQRDLSADSLAALLTEIFADPAGLAAKAAAAKSAGQPDAAARLADMTEELGRAA
jgi:UDP-N-acetylglucosamine--N-acetylmuramyl-(pentapeptide) pyrophosphoryl-undecaprenol N-acetylglucosamine transferase